MQKKQVSSQYIKEQLEAYKKQLETELLEVNGILDFIKKHPDACTFIEYEQEVFNN